VGFHGIPLEPSGHPIQSDAQLGTPHSHGCVRESQAAARLLWGWAPMGTKVVVLP
jgi:lipoprotein-anchoring transpeptidase ErfK/SrfK